MGTRFEQPTKRIAFAAIAIIIGALCISSYGAYELTHASSLAQNWMRREAKRASP